MLGNTDIFGPLERRLGVVTDRHRSTSRILRNRCPPVVDVGLVREVFPVARRRVELLHGQRVFRCGLPHARRHVVLVVARVSAVAVRRARGVISVTAVLMAAVLLGLGVFVPPLVRVDLVDGLPGRHRAVVAVLLFFFFQGILNVIVVGLWRRFEQLLVESAQPLCPLAKT